MKDISTIDRNYAIQTDITSNNGLCYYNIKQAPFVITGFPWFKDNGLFERIPREKLNGLSDELRLLACHTAGGMVRFKSNSRIIVLEAELISAVNMPHMPLTGSSGFDFFFGSSEVKEKYFKTAIPVGGSTAVRCTIEDIILPPGSYDVRINFPLYNGVKSVRIGICNGSNILPPTPFQYEKPVVFYGSSITQGGCASRPGNAYTHIIGRELNCNIVNLGFSGNAKGEVEMAKIISEIDMSMFIMDYDHNAPTAEYLEKTHYNFYKTIRDAKPILPIVLITKPDFGYSLDDNALRRDVVYSTFTAAVNSGDGNIYFIDGEKLFGREHRDCCTVDGTHPNDYGFVLMADGICPVIKKILFEQRERNIKAYRKEECYEIQGVERKNNAGYSGAADGLCSKES